MFEKEDIRGDFSISINKRKKCLNNSLYFQCCVAMQCCVFQCGHEKGEGNGKVNLSPSTSSELLLVEAQLGLSSQMAAEIAAVSALIPHSSHRGSAHFHLPFWRGSPLS